MQKQGYVYIITNRKNGTLYTGVTSDLIRRIYEHKHNITQGFCAKYHLNMLVYYEVFESIERAIMREKQLKAGNRKKKLDLINAFNPSWEDLYESLF